MTVGVSAAQNHVYNQFSYNYVKVFEPMEKARGLWDDTSGKILIIS